MQSNSLSLPDAISFSLDTNLFSEADNFTIIFLLLMGIVYFVVLRKYVSDFTSAVISVVVSGITIFIMTGLVYLARSQEQTIMTSRIEVIEKSKDKSFLLNMGYNRNLGESDIMIVKGHKLTWEDLHEEARFKISAINCSGDKKHDNKKCDVFFKKVGDNNSVYQAEILTFLRYVAGSKTPEENNLVQKNANSSSFENAKPVRH